MEGEGSSTTVIEQIQGILYVTIQGKDRSSIMKQSLVIRRIRLYDEFKLKRWTHRFPGLSKTDVIIILDRLLRFTKMGFSKLHHLFKSRFPDEMNGVG